GGASHSFREPEAHDRVALTPRWYNPFPEPDPGTPLGAAARERPPRPDGAPLLQWLCGVPYAGAGGHRVGLRGASGGGGGWRPSRLAPSVNGHFGWWSGLSPVMPPRSRRPRGVRGGVL